MFRRIFLSAIAAGLIAGVITSFVQEFTTTPIILEAEGYENGTKGEQTAVNESLRPTFVHAVPEAHDHLNAHSVPEAHDHLFADEGHGHSAWAPADGLERTFYTTLANVLTGIGFALILIAGFALRGEDVDGRKGVLWGIAGFAAFSLLPALGLPPEVPGSFAAELSARQGWWLFAAVASAAGIWLAVFGRANWLKVAGIVVVALPHLVGAPHPEAVGGAAPPELAGHFVAASLVTAAVFWVALGWLSGSFYRRFA
jgi:cobalt transporter subunit CbtA